MQPVPAVQQPLVQGQDTITIIPSHGNTEDYSKNKRRVRHRLPKTFLPETISYIITTVVLVAISWLSLVILCQRLGIDPHGIVLFICMIVTSYHCGQMALPCGLPPVVPMYLIGCAFRSFGLLNQVENWAVFSNLRYLTITVVLVKGGLSMDLGALKTYPTQVLKSSFVICTVEAMALTVATNIFLPEMFPLLWSFVFGFVNSPTSPTKFASTLAALKASKRYSYINPSMQAIWGFSAPIEIIYCITVFSVLMTIIARSSGSAVEALLHGCVKVGLGFIAGTVWGLVVGYLPHKDDINCSVKRFTSLWLGVISIYFGAKSYGWGPGGPLGTFVGGISANTVWKAIGSSDKKSVLKSLNKLWDWVMEPMLFSLVGYEIDFRDLPMLPTDIGITIGALFIGWVFRCLISIAVFYTSGFKRHEIAFLTVAGLPKATVQAAISPQLLDLVRGTDDEGRAKALILSGIISCIIITTTSTLFLHYFSEKLLKRYDKPVPSTENNNTA